MSQMFCVRSRTCSSANIEVVTEPDSPHGCFMVQGALACSDSADPLKCEMAKRRSQFETLLRKRFARAIAEGDLPKSRESGRFSAFCNDAVQRIRSSGGRRRYAFATQASRRGCDASVANG